MLRMLSSALLTLTLSIVATHLPARSNAQELGTPPSTNDDAADGQRIFATTCAACHGLDARGSEHAPDIAGKRDAQQLTGEELLHIIQNGIPGTGMPAFRALNTAQVHSVIRYLRTLQGQGTATQLPGDPRRGKILFFGQAGCARCHMANGQGGFIASDLSSYGGARPAADIRNAITDPGKSLDSRSRPVHVVTTSGMKQSGLVRNEDNFSLQLIGLDGTFQLFQKSELRSIEYQPDSLMPADYASRLSSFDLDDLVNYVVSVGRTDKKGSATKE